MKVSLEQLLDAMTPVVRKAMLRRFTPDCCIGTCKILQAVFQEFGFRAKPFPVSVFIFNDKAVELFDAGKSFPQTEAERDATGAWSVGLVAGGVTPNGRQGFGGHLVLSVDGWLVDASIQQADRPTRRITLPALLSFKPEKGFFADRSKGQKQKGMVNGCLVVYTRINNIHWRIAPNWRDAYAGQYQTYAEIMQEVIKQL